MLNFHVYPVEIAGRWSDQQFIVYRHIMQRIIDKMLNEMLLFVEPLIGADTFVWVSFSDINRQ